MTIRARVLPATLAALLLLLLVPACRPPVPTDELPRADETLEAVGRRLGREVDPGKLAAIARDERQLLKWLTPEERDALGRDALRFGLNGPADVFVLANVEPGEPFWLAEQGFRPTGDTLENADGTFRVHHRRYPAGPVGLGVNGLDRSKRSQYAVLVRSIDGGHAVALTCDGPGTIPAVDGFSPYHDADIPFARVPDRLKGCEVLQTSHESRHEHALVAGKVWKTRQPSTPRPDQLVVSFGEDPARMLSVSWRTDTTVEKSALRIVPEAHKDGGSDSIRFLRGKSHAIRSAGLLNDPVVLRHAVRVDGLEPDTPYAYSVGDGSPGGWSDWHTVRTAPEPGRDFSFLYMGDAQNELERWGGLLHEARRRHPDAGFLILAGDLVDRGNERSNWDHFFHRAQGVFESLPLMPAVGNHEYLDKGPEIYRGTFDLPRNGPAGIDPNLCYSFEYADAFVAVLDSNLGIYDEDLARDQAEWLDRALSKTRATWKFVTFHHPVYASHPTRENPILERVWGPVFDRHHVDLVLQGHDHAYLRSRPMREGRAVATPAEGTVYTVAVSGEKFYGQHPRSFIAKGMTGMATYQLIEVSPSRRTLRYRAFDRDGREVDSLAIEKPATGDRLTATP